MKAIVCLLVAALAFAHTAAQSRPTSKRKAVMLADISWVEAEKILGPETVVVIPLGAEAKEHGPHLPLGTDFIQAEFLKKRIAERVDAVIAPTVNYNYYPSFIEYAGSTHLSVSTSRSVIYDICISLSRYGVRRFYVLNTGVSTNVPLAQVSEQLKDDGILMRYTDITKPNDEIKALKKEARGTHANEEETSTMLYISPNAVDMKKAVQDYGVQKGTAQGLSPDPNKNNTTYSPTGIFGDPTLATRAKGKKIVNIELRAIEAEINAMRTAALPAGLTEEEIARVIDGKYRTNAGAVFTFVRRKKELSVIQDQDAAISLGASGVFRYGNRAYEVSFVRDAEGAGAGAIIEINGRRQLANKILDPR